MREILGNNLAVFFTNAVIKANQTYKGKRYEIWEVSEYDYEKMCNMSEEDFTDYASDDGAWWRGSEGSIMDIPDVEFIINGEKMIGWNTRGEYENYQYANLSDYLCYGIGASQPKNVCALAIDLAKYNNITMSELFTKYEG